MDRWENPPVQKVGLVPMDKSGGVGHNDGA